MLLNPLTLSLILNALIVNAEIPPVDEFVSGTDFSSPDQCLVDALNTNLIKQFGSGPAVCGDNLCDISREETCLTCPEDCGGPCRLDKPYERCVNENHFALTFDDGPSEYTLKIIEILKKEDIKATFFVNGIHVLDRPHVLKKVYDAGHIIGQHTFSHRSLETGKGSSDRNFTELKYDHMMGEIYVSDAVVAEVINKTPVFLRPPYLEYSPTSMAFMETAGIIPVNINVDSNDWKCKTSKCVIKNIKSAFKEARSEPSWIYLQHDIFKHSLAALPKVIKYLRSKKVEFVTMDVCLDTKAYRDENDSPFLAPDIHECDSSEPKEEVCLEKDSCCNESHDDSDYREIVDGVIPPVDEFVSGTEFSSPDPCLVDALNTDLIKHFGKGPAVCGDNVCDISREETCLTCPEDCGGPCKLDKPYKRCVNENHFALTFDDGPSEYTLEILDILEKEDIKGTFFVNGIHVLDRPHVLQKLYDAGHVIGQHTFSHRSLETGKGSSNRNFTELKYDHMMGEIYVSDAVVAEVINKTPIFLRPPYLEYSPTSMAFMETAGIIPVNINVDSNDWRCQNSTCVIRNVRSAFKMAHSEPSWIYLQHDTYKHSLEALPEVIKYLRSKEVEFVTMDVCLGTKAYRDDNDSPFLAPNIQECVYRESMTREECSGMNKHSCCNESSHGDAVHDDNVHDTYSQLVQTDAGSNPGTSLSGAESMHIGMYALVLAFCAVFVL